MNKNNIILLVATGLFATILYKYNKDSLIEDSGINVYEGQKIVWIDKTTVATLAFNSTSKPNGYQVIRYDFDKNQKTESYSRDFNHIYCKSPSGLLTLRHTENNQKYFLSIDEQQMFNPNENIIDLVTCQVEYSGGTYDPPRVNTLKSADTGNSEFTRWIDDDYEIITLRYEPFMKSYLLAARKRSEKKQIQAYWWMDDAGVITRIIELNEDNAISSDIHDDLIPFKNGIVAITGGSGELPDHSSTHGLYYLTGDEKKLITQGDIRSTSLSADGCNLAISINNDIFELGKNFESNGKYTLKKINLCNYNSN